MKKAQVTVFIILAIVLVMAVALFFLLRNTKVVEVFQPSMPAPEEYIRKCTEDNVQASLKIILPQGGYISPELYKSYKDNKVAYLCYNKNYYYPCVNQNPLLINYIENEIKSYITSRVEDCFYKLKLEYEDRDYNVDENYAVFNVNLNPKEINVNIQKKFTISRNEETRNYNEFNIKINSYAYNLAEIANEIVNQEVKFCYFEYLGYNLLYPEYSVEKIDISGDTKLYSITNKISKEKFNFAVRSCAIPAGL